MFSLLVLLIASIIDASVVDLPLPVGPVTSTSPLLRVYISITASGIPNFDASGILLLKERNTAAQLFLCLK